MSATERHVPRDGRALDRLVAEISACRICRDQPEGSPLPHEPRPVLRVSQSARIAVCGQAPGTRVHASGVPFSDPSGERLRDWMGVTADEFYDVRRIAIVPMGFCFPGLDAKGGDLPPRRECSKLWHARLLTLLPQLELVLLVGHYAQRWHLGPRAGPTLTETVAAWRSYLDASGGRADGAVEGARYIPLPHPSWRNNAWIKRHSWLESELVPVLRSEVRARL